MTPAQPTADHPETPLRSGKGLFALSVVYVLLCAVGFFDHPSPLLLCGLLCVTAFGCFCAFQFGSRLFTPVRAAARSAALTDRNKAALRKLRTATGLLCALALLIAVTAHLIDRRRFGDYFLYVYIPVCLFPGSLTDLLGEPQYFSRGTFSPRTEWTDLKPLHSDSWGNRA